MEEVKEIKDVYLVRTLSSPCVEDSLVEKAHKRNNSPKLTCLVIEANWITMDWAR